MAEITLKGTISDGSEFTVNLDKDMKTLHLVRKKLSAIDLSPLKNCKKLQRIVLNANQLPNIDLSPLKNCKELRILHLGNNLLSSIDLAPLENCQLESFFLNHNQFSSIDLSPLRTWTNLQSGDLARRNSASTTSARGDRWLLNRNTRSMSSVDSEPLQAR